jgi:hypothetical protein
MHYRKLLIAAIATIGIAVATTDSQAQMGGFGGFGGGSRGSSRSQGGGRDQSNNQESRNNRPVQQELDSYEQTEFRLTLLEEDLHLQPAQLASWDSFAGKVRAYASDLVRARTRAMTTPASGGTTTGIQMIEQAADAARNRATALDDVAGAAKNLYAGLTPDQKMLADVRIATIIAPRPAAVPAAASNLPDLGSSSRTQR